MKKNILSLLSFMLFLGFVGCGYTTRSMIADKFRTIHVGQFVNKIDITRDVDSGSKYKVFRPTLDSDITRTVSNKFIFDGNLKTIASESADLQLKGELIEFRRDPLRYTSSDDVQEYRLSLVVNIELWDKKENKLLWQENRFIGETTYFVTGPSAKSENVAIIDAINDLSRRIVDRVVEQW